MSDEEVKEGVVATDINATEADPPANESNEVQQNSQASDSAIKARNSQEYNWAEARRKMQELERQNLEFRQRFDQFTNPSKTEVDEIDKLGSEDLVTKSHVMKMAERMARQIATQAIKERERETVDERLMIKYPDFAEVVSKDNIELLKQTEPELARSLSHNPDDYEKGIAVYKALKRLGITQGSTVNSDKERAKKNSEKPVSLSTVSKSSAIGNAQAFENGLTKEVKAALWAEMQEIRKRA
jgi:hypothetical protein